MILQHFDNYLLDALQEFHEWQLEHTENGVPPYPYDTLGLAEWLEFERLTGDKRT